MLSQMEKETSDNESFCIKCSQVFKSFWSLRPVHFPRTEVGTQFAQVLISISLILTFIGPWEYSSRYGSILSNENRCIFFSFIIQDPHCISALIIEMSYFA